MPRSLAAAALAALLLTACGEDNFLSPPQFDNVVDTVTIFAVRGTAIPQPSAYIMADRRAARTDQTSLFDFAFDLSAAAESQFLPAAVLGTAPTTGTSPGLLATSQPFDSVTAAEVNGYVINSAVPARPGQVYYIRSRLLCTVVSSPLYGKLEVLSVDQAARTVTFRVLVNLNCGYRSLQPGRPAN